MPALLDLPPSVSRSRRSTIVPNFPRLAGPHDLARLLPAKGDPDYLWVLCEMVRADLEMTWTEGKPRRLREYKRDFPELFQDGPILRAIANEEYHIRESHGDHPNAEEYAREFGIALFDDPPSPSGEYATVEGKVKVVADAPVDLPPAGDYDLGPEKAGGLVITTAKTASFPAVGETFLGFRLVEELGRGAFARVYLARQVALADRAVALKVTTRPSHEPDRLAKLQHTNIVPIFSVHSAGMLQAVCMPFLGRATLADTLCALRKNGQSPVTGSELFSTVQDVATVQDQPADAPTPPLGIPLLPREPDLSPQPVRDMLGRMSYLDAVAWVIARLAEGLSHAHRRGIRHYDLKPANVLLGDDGQPMLLDFNLAHDVAAGKREQLGGTVMYMAPEQLEEVRDHAPGRVSEQTDLYSLGVIFYELLTGRHPFPLTGQANKVAAALELRLAGPLPVRSINPSVSPAIAAIVHKLLDPIPAKRYASAEYLWTDLDRHAIHLPLLYTPEPSLRESFRKWRHRSPGVLRRIGFAAAALTVAVAGAWGYTAHQAHRTVAAEDTARRFRHDLAALRVDLTYPVDSRYHSAGVAKATQWLAAFGVTEAGVGNWTSHPVVKRLGPSDRLALAADIGELAALRALAERASDRPAADRDQARLRAGNWMAAAVECFRGQAVPAAVRDAQALLAGSAELPSPPGENGVEEDTARAQYLRAVTHYLAGRYAAAASNFEAVTRANADHFAAQFLLGRCQYELHEHARAQERFDMARALAPGDYRPVYNRGLSLLRIGRSADAEAEFDTTIGLAPTFADAYYHRALARESRKSAEALADLARAAELGGDPFSVLSVKVRVYLNLKDPKAAQATREEILKAEAKTASDFAIRGFTLQQMKRYGDALAAYRKSSDLNPNDFASWYNQASALEASKGKPGDMLSVLDKAVATNPKSALAVIGRALIHARVGNRAEAVRDAERGLQLPCAATQVYQAACVYALTGRDEPADLERAMELLRKAARMGYHDWEKMENDADLSAVQQVDEYRSLIESIKELVK